MKTALVMTLLFVNLFCVRGSATESGPDSSFVIAPNYTFRATDSSFSIRQYHNAEYQWQFWVNPKHGSAYRLPDENLNNYGADWNLSPNKEWLVRTQKTGSGTYVLFLYHKGDDDRFASVWPGKFDDLIYDFYERHSGLTKEQRLIDHSDSEFFRWVGSRRLVISLSGQSTLSQPMWVTDKWLVAYDMKTDHFLLTDDLIDKNVGRIYPVIHVVSEPVGAR